MAAQYCSATPAYFRTTSLMGCFAVFALLLVASAFAAWWLTRSAGAGMKSAFGLRSVQAMRACWDWRCAREFS
jgi:hypothetical protein